MIKRKKFIITPRVKYSKKRKTFFYSLEKNWFDYAKVMNIELSVYNYIDSSILKKFDGVIFSGGNDLVKVNENIENTFREKNEIKLLEESLKQKKTIIGICKGFQLINFYLKGEIEKTRNHVKKSQKIIIKKNNITNRSFLEVNYFHNYKISNLSIDLENIGFASDKSTEIALNINKKILCLMFHPERKNKSQKMVNSLIKKFIDLCK